ncbi:hypothetical protein FRAAL1730 [Frankia alni ACN14a]|uniref:Uncharacterized protein n=1 Tax=Frankia alni (strain DSM 45986 / CECT 9034 / ACN14a) TaxID=326424 RepID=Q0RPZ6_FRAAA|nr:hypothetical protein FRAAL1730 [Frankia alni ACN14a]
MTVPPCDHPFRLARRFGRRATLLDKWISPLSNRVAYASRIEQIFYEDLLGGGQPEAVAGCAMTITEVVR